MEGAQETAFLFLVSDPAVKMGPEVPGAFQARQFPRESFEDR